MHRLPRLAVATLPTLDHFTPDLIRGLQASQRLDARAFPIRTQTDLTTALDWAHDPVSDSIWFEFCWPPFPALIAATDFGGRRVIVRVHRIEAYETDHVARADWSHVTDLIVVSSDMARSVREVRPGIEHLVRLHIVHNGVDLDRYPALEDFDPYRIGWCGSMIARKNPTLALQILHRLRVEDTRYTMHMASAGGDRLTIESFNYQAARLGMADAIEVHGRVNADDMPSWHARNGVLLSTSLHESFGYAIAEAAAAGCDIAVLDHVGATEFWPDEVRFVAVEQAARMIAGATPDRWRTLIKERFALTRQVDSVLAITAPATERPSVVGGWTPREDRMSAPVSPPDVAVAEAETPLVCRGGRQFRVADHPSSCDGMSAFLGDAEAATLGFFDAVLPRCKRMIDIGAYVGFMSLYSALQVPTVHAVEASPSHQDLLRANIALNPSLIDRITVHPFAVGAADTVAGLYRKALADSGSSLFQSVERGAILQGQKEADVTVRSATLVLQELALDSTTLLKIDIEGAEYAVLPAIAALLAERQPYLQVSFHPFNIVRDDPYLTELARLRAMLDAADALTSYRFVYLYGPMATGRDGWRQFDLADRPALLHDYLLSWKQVPRVRSPQIGFVDAVGFSREPLPSLIAG